jgi:hypothetical protein
MKPKVIRLTYSILKGKPSNKVKYITEKEDQFASSDIYDAKIYKDEDLDINQTCEGECKFSGHYKYLKESVELEFKTNG